MWHRFKNLVSSIRTYGTLRPDFVVRRQVLRALRDRPSLTQEEWFASICPSWRIAYPVAQFVYIHLPKYSGLESGRLWLSDRLDDDLQWTQVCWFDWSEMLCNDFWRCFGIDIRNELDELNLFTVGDLVKFLNAQFTQTSERAEC